VNLSKTPPESKFRKIRSTVLELFHLYRQKDGRAEEDIFNGHFASFAKAPKINLGDRGYDWLHDQHANFEGFQSRNSTVLPLCATVRHEFDFSRPKIRFSSKCSQAVSKKYMVPQCNHHLRVLRHALSHFDLFHVRLLYDRNTGLRKCIVCMYICMLSNPQVAAVTDGTLTANINDAL